MARHIARYLDVVAIDDVPVGEIAAWWKIRGKIAHGASLDVDMSALMRLTNCFKTALRRQAGIEAIPEAPVPA